ncbi:MAG: hypothetical protein ACFFE5_14630 [Candidatus Thorarchaeota archaeon]
MKQESSIEIENSVLRTLRESPHRLSINEICSITQLDQEKVHIGIRTLLDDELIVQDRRDTVSWDDSSATYYTNPMKRHLIDNL